MATSQVVASPPSVLVRLASAYVDAQRRVDEAEEGIKRLKEFRDRAEKRLAEEMKTQQVKSFRTDKLGGFNVQVMVYPNVTDREALSAWVRKKRYKWLYTTQIHASKLKAFVKERMEKGEELPPGTDAYLAPVIRTFK